LFFFPQNWQDYHDEEDGGAGNKSIEFVLAFNSSERLNQIKRQIFERNLANEGLILERDESQKIHFIKIHATKEVLCRYAEILKFKFPIKLDENESEDQLKHDRRLSKTKKSIFEKFYQLFRLNRKLFPEQRYELFHEYSRDKSYLFDIHDPTFFPTFVRISVVNFILERTPFADNADDNCIGIDRLLSDGAYSAAYPLHDGHHGDPESQRGLLYKEWGILKNWLKHQPLDSIKNYFGVKVALYFSWLGFYTNMLILPSILGVLVFIIGISTMFTNYYVNSICHANSTVVLCPKCDDCGYTTLSDTCVYARINHILDNNFTIFFALCMSIWASIYLELWKRYSATIVHRWGSNDFSKQSEHARPAYITRIKRNKQAVTKINPTTRQQEPTLDFKFKLPNYMLSYTIIILYVSEKNKCSSNNNLIFLFSDLSIYCRSNGINCVSNVYAELKEILWR
jgi:anoctamin-1